jgi:hypothetical protein
MNIIIRRSATISALALLASAQLHAEEVTFSFGESTIDRPHEWQTFSTGMSDQQYRSVYRHNKHRISRFVKSYSKNALLSMGIPKTGIKVLGVAAGLAANRDATLYLNKSKILALQFKDVVNDDRTMFLGLKMDW